MITIKNKKDFLAILMVTKNILNEINIKLTPERMLIKAIHPSSSNVIFVDIEKAFFEEYDIKEDITYTINLEDLIKILKLCKEDINIKSDIDYLKIDSGKNKFEFSYFIGSYDDRPKPQMEHDISLNCSSKEFFDNIQNGLTIDAIGKLNVEENDFFIESKSHRIKSKIKIEDYEQVKGNNEYCFYDFDLLNLCNGLKNIYEKINIEYSNDKPVFIFGENDLIKCEFILANRVE